MKINQKDYITNTIQGYLIFIGVVVLFGFIPNDGEPSHFNLLDGYLFASFLAVIMLVHREACGLSKDYSKKEEEKLKELRQLDK